MDLATLEQLRDDLERSLRNASEFMDRLRVSRGVPPGAITPDTLRYSSAWEEANNNLHAIFRDLQSVNAKIVKIRKSSSNPSPKG